MPWAGGGNEGRTASQIEGLVVNEAAGGTVGAVTISVTTPALKLDTTQAQVAYDGDHTISNGSGISTTQRNWDHAVTVTATDIASAATLISSGLRSQLGFGVGGVASVGTGHAATLDALIQGAGSSSNEYTPLFTLCRADIGTGYTQSAGPVGRLWGADLNVHGPLDVQPNLLNGVTSFINNYYNGSPATTLAAAMWLATRKGSGGGTDAAHAAATTYPVDVGLGIVGTSGATNTGVGFTTAIKVGGTGSGWGATSRHGTAIDIADWETYGLRVSGRTAAATGPAISIAPSCGAVVIGGTTGSFSSTALLEVLPAASADPVVAFRGTSGAALSMTLGNTSGNSKYFASGGADNFITGTAAGDTGIYVVTAAKSFHLGGTISTIEVTQANTLGFHNTTPIAKPTGWGAPTGTATKTTFATSTVTLSELAERVKALIDNLTSYGLIGA